MFSELRKPFLIAAFVTSVLSLILQLGSLGVLKHHAQNKNISTTLSNLSERTFEAFPELKDARTQYKPPANFIDQGSPPGLGITYLSLIEMLIIFSLGLMLLSLTIGPRLQGRLQGILTIIFSISVIIMSIAMIFRAFIELQIMISLFIAAPFGTIMYLGMYGTFNTGVSQATLGLLLLLKLALFVFLIAAHQRFLQNRGLIRLLIIAIVLILLTTFLHSIVPSILVSITDAVAALIISIFALIGAIIFLVFSIPGIVKALRLDRA